MKTLRNIKKILTYVGKSCMLISSIIILSACQKEEITEYTVTFWSQTWEGSGVVVMEMPVLEDIKVYVNDEYIGKITRQLDSEPDCGASECVTFTTSDPTPFWWHAETEDGTYWWIKNKVTPKDKSCIMVNL